eukprot:364478-Chlamydomonas_euryale.AAC.2
MNGADKRGGVKGHARGTHARGVAQRRCGREGMKAEVWKKKYERGIHRTHTRTKAHKRGEKGEVIRGYTHGIHTRIVLHERGGVEGRVGYNTVVVHGRDASVGSMPSGPIFLPPQEVVVHGRDASVGSMPSGPAFLPPQVWTPQAWTRTGTRQHLSLH